jgi:hypothetical protein
MVEQTSQWPKIHTWSTLVASNMPSPSRCKIPPSRRSKKVNFDIINNNSGLYFIKGMRYSGNKFFIKYLTDHFICTIIKKKLLCVPTSNRCYYNKIVIKFQYYIWAIETFHQAPLLCPSIDQLDPPKASSNKYHHYWQDIHDDSSLAHNYLF